MATTYPDTDAERVQWLLALQASRTGPHMHLQPGDRCCTGYSKRLTTHTVVERLENQQSQTRVMYVVKPPVPGSSGGPIDASWFSVASQGWRG
jgi:hypothetical protein